MTFVSWTGVDSDSLNNLGFFLILLEPKAGSRLCESEAEIRAAEIEKEEQRKMYHLPFRGPAHVHTGFPSIPKPTQVKFMEIKASTGDLNDGHAQRFYH